MVTSDAGTAFLRAGATYPRKAGAGVLPISGQHALILWPDGCVPHFHLLFFVFKTAITGDY